MLPYVRITIETLGRRIGLRRDAPRAPGRAPEWHAGAAVLATAANHPTPPRAAGRAPEWHAAASILRPPQIQPQTRRIESLLPAKIGLDKGGHFRKLSMRAAATAVASLTA